MTAVRRTATRTPHPVSQPLSDGNAATAEQSAPALARVAAPPSRAGNAMQRARAGILTAAAELIAEEGLHGVSMAGVARRSGVAKATVYNHVRDRDELVTALLIEQWTTLQRVCADQPRDQRLAAAASWISADPVLDGLRRFDPGALVALAHRAVSDPQVLQAVTSWIPEGRDSEAALRWLISFGLEPAASAAD